MQSVLPMTMHVPAYVCVSGLLVQLSTMCMSCLYWMQGVTDWDRTQKRLCLQISAPGVYTRHMCDDLAENGFRAVCCIEIGNMCILGIGGNAC